MLFVAGVYVWQLKSQTINTSENNVPSSGITVPGTGSNLQGEEATGTSQDNYFWNPLAIECKFRLETPESKTGLVSWKTPELLTEQVIFKPASETQPYGYEERTYEVGKILSGKYANGDMLLSLVGGFGPGGVRVYRSIRFENKIYLLTKYSEDFDTEPEFTENIAATPILDSSYDLPDLNFPEQLELKNPNLSLTYADDVGFLSNGAEFFCADNYKQVQFDEQVGKIYTDDSAKPESRGMFGFYTKAPDSTLRYYTLKIPFVGKDNIPLITWSNNTINKNEYSYQAITGCGASKFLDVDLEVKPEELKQAGTTINGDKVYEFSNPDHPYLKKTYDERNNYLPESAQISYQDFIKSRPLFYWIDPLNRIVKFKNAKFQPLAECAKPVIYLYPKQKQLVEVEISPKGGLLFTEPQYDGLWKVYAYPDGKIINTKDNKTYPYLFWEGRGGLYQMPNKGFVSAKDSLAVDISQKLSEIGLNNIEIKDFLEYWLPYMQDSPYYFYTFLDTKMVDNIAPLRISPKPDTIIRVIMDFKPLAEPTPVQSYTIKPVERKGFTVIEWGGVKR